MKKCKVCGDKTDSVFNINFKMVPICEPCAESIFLQQATWYVRTSKEKKQVPPVAHPGNQLKSINMEFKKYRRTQIAEMRPVTTEEIEHGLKGDSIVISVSQVDLDNGSPKEGDMIARNPDNHADQWLVAKEYFEKNFEPMEKSMPRFCPPKCPHLNLTEEDQDNLPEGARGIHVCNKFEKRLYHGHYHPNIIKPDECYFMADE